MNVPEAERVAPLRGVRVVDLTRILAGPFATMIMGDLGADVIKVERPGTGDDSRHWGPPFVSDTASYFLAVNRSKRSIAVDLKHEEGRAVILRMLAGADLLMSNFSPGVMDRLGLGEQSLTEAFPKLICCTVTGHPSADERSRLPSFDLVIQAETGLMDLNGPADGPPTKVGISIADELAGLYLVQGVMAALLHRDRTGEVRPVEVALNESTLSAFTYQAQQYLVGGARPTRLGNVHPSLVPYRSYRAEDGEFVVGVANEAQWSRFCSSIRRPELAHDPRFLTNGDRVANRDVLEPLIEARLVERSRDDWIRDLRAAAVPCGPVRSVAEALDAEMAMDTGLIGDAGDGMRTVGCPIRFGGTRPAVRRPAPSLGEHTDEVLAELGLDAAAIAGLRKAGVVA